MTAGRRALVTGASGFVGSALTASLVRDGWHVAALVRAGRASSPDAAIDMLTGDVQDYSSLVAAMRGARPDVVFHLAGDTSVRRFSGEWEAVDRAVSVNLLGTLNVVRAAAQSGVPIQSVVRAGGLEEYGTGPTPSDEDQREQPSSPYSASQVSATHWCQMLQGTLPFAVVTLRPALIYGPRQREDFLIPALITALLKEKRFALSNGVQRRDYIYIDDVVRAFRSAADAGSGLAGQVINVSSGHQYQVSDVAGAVADRMKRRHLLDVGSADPRAGDLPDVSGRNGRAERLLDWRPEVGLDEGLDKTIKWFARRDEE